MDGGRVELPLSNFGYALGERFDDAAQAVGQVFIGPGGGGGGFAAAHAPLTGLVGGCEGDAVTIEAGQALALAGGSVSFTPFQSAFGMSWSLQGSGQRVVHLLRPQGLETLHTEVAGE